MNNVEAAVVLLKNGANKDMQSNKVGSAGADGSLHLVPPLSEHGSTTPPA